MAIRILHLLSNWKWTERSEPAVELALAQQALGANVCFVCDRSPTNVSKAVAPYAAARGVKSIVELHLPKHFCLYSLYGDVFRLRRLIQSFNPHIVHYHMPNAHLLGTLAGMTNGSFKRVRSCYTPYGPKRDLRSRFLYGHHTDGLVVIGRKAKARTTRSYNFPRNNILIAEPGIDLDRFSPKRKVPLFREDFGLGHENFVIGIVTRIRQSRRIDVALGTVRLLSERFPNIRLLIVGRGREGAKEEVVDGPSRTLGITDKVILPGYCEGDRLVAAYRAMDVLVYPMPGTDQTCRTVREALASGVPVIAPKIGFLPELLEDGINGRFIELSAQGLAGTLEELIKNPERLGQMAENAAKGAKERFSTYRQARKVLAFYEQLLSGSTA